jgi:hypothetical protein
MQKRIVVTVLVGLLFSISSPIFAATPKAGASCTKAGSTAISAGKQYTCIKSGKKLVWDKGVAIAKPVPLPTPTPSATPTPTPSAIPSTIAAPPSTDGPDKIAPLMETPCLNKGEEKTSGFLLVCYQDRTRGLIWIRKGTEVAYKFLGAPISLKNNSDLWTPRSSATFRQSTNPIVSLPSSTGTQLSPTDISQCKLKDLHDKQISPDGPMAHGFPVEPMNPKYFKDGTLKVGILPVDFIDAPGESTLQADLKKNIAMFEDWFKYYSGGKLKLEITTSDAWIHSNKLSSAYDWKSTYPNLKWLDMAQKVGQSYVDLAPASFDFSQLGALLIYMPQKENKIDVDLTLQSLEYSTKQGKQYVAVEAPPILLYKRGQEPWVFWVHELLHGIGIAGHAPGGDQGLPLGIMDSQILGSYSINAWEQFILGWLPDSQMYCIAPDKVSGQIVSLSPMEREESATKAVVIPLTDHSGLVVQSNREDKWSSKQYSYGFPDNFSGVVVYLVDTRNGNYRSKGYGVDTPEFSGIVPKEIAPEDLFYANYVKIDGEPSRQFGCPAGLATPPGLENTKGGGCWQWTVLNYLVGTVGDSFTIAGINIQVVGTSKLDYVKITRKP